MKKLKSYVLATILASFLFSCSKHGSASFQITVTDGRTGSPSSGAAIRLYTDSSSVINNAPEYTGTTNQAGMAKFSVRLLNKYYVIVENGSEKNVYDGYIPVGVFKSQQDIGNHPIQSPLGVVGGLIFKDINFDGKIDDIYDKVVAPQISFVASAQNDFDISIY
ncbi:hypothetical protein [Mucilaginibacter lappiensis]|uniref:Carboxypeptidase regulatory-like domain-containing protein n=1 Tax=Mucilaginibacter lappiensis TaxID=354630 RepID=A0A841JN82_9SPHI|nr:hypothetical protein [Mucilaginibacter lappiensis]MBB6129371.1 hypothetical protein [Mucilaginibacter lappiensis]